MKILAIDYGEKNIGLAVSDEKEIATSPLPPLKVNDENEALEGLKLIIDNIKPGKLLLGIPQAFPDSPSYKAVEKLGDALKLSTKLEIVYWDEDMSSKRAEQGRSKKFKKQKSHSEAARLVLQEYLNSEFHM